MFTRVGATPFGDLIVPEVIEDYPEITGVTFPEMDTPTAGKCRCIVESTQAVYDAILLDTPKYIVDP